MCLAVIALCVHPRYPLVVAANRDEYHARAATPAAWGETPPWQRILAGRDLAAGGTWFGVNRDGRFALVTNVRANGDQQPGSQSRGGIVPQVLGTDIAPSRALTALDAQRERYAGVNVLAGSPTGAAWWSNRADGVRTMTTGVHGLSNAALDTPWPKVMRATDALRTWASTGDADSAPLFAMLLNRDPVPDAALPSTGLSPERERLLATPFIVDARYGTRCTTVLTIDHAGELRFHERTFAPDGSAVGDAIHVYATNQVTSATVIR
ncbi:MAG: NRDE family protein [Betaproteobacteria bacterium]